MWGTPRTLPGRLGSSGAYDRPDNRAYGEWHFDVRGKPSHGKGLSERLLRAGERRTIRPRPWPRERQWPDLAEATEFDHRNIRDALNPKESASCGPVGSVGPSFIVTVNSMSTLTLATLISPRGLGSSSKGLRENAHAALGT